MQYPITTATTDELYLMASAATMYTYDDNSDQLLTYGNESFAYDLLGNPTTYRGKTATFAYGRRMMSLDGVSFTYDARGNRLTKNGLSFTYDSHGNLLAQSNGLEFLYDHTGLFAIKRGDAVYYCRKNPQNDILCLLDSDGSLVVQYKYDAWGNHKVLDAAGIEIVDTNHIGHLNPFRYRSYYYDSELGLYFLQSRYYDPELGRFVTIDDLSYLDPDTVNGLNLYAYCLNNPVMYSDPTGHIAIGVLMALGIAGAFVIGGLISAISQYFTYDGDINHYQVAVDGAFAGITMGLGFTGMPLWGMVLWGLLSGGGQYTLDTAVFHDDFTWHGFGFSTALGGIGGFFGQAGAKNSDSILDSLDDIGKIGKKALKTAETKYGIGPTYQKVANLWSKRVANSEAKAFFQNVKNGVIKGLKANVLTYVFNEVANWVFTLFSK